MSNKLEISSRLHALHNDSSKSLGVSCNTYQLHDSIPHIAEGHAWAYHVLSYQGAPSIDFSELRGKGSALNKGGSASGAVSFMKPFDSIISTMRREEKKNGAGIAFLSWNHKDLSEFLEWQPNACYKAVWIPANDTEEAKEFLCKTGRIQALSKLADAYNRFKCFLVKRPALGVDNEQLLVNLCTEVEIPHRGSCVLGAHNLAAYKSVKDFSQHFAREFAESAQQMLQHMFCSLAEQQGSPLACTSPNNRQFGLGVFGLASFLGNNGVTYAELAIALKYLRQNESAIVTTKASEIAKALYNGYMEAANEVRDHVTKAFCIQPTVSTARRCKDAISNAVSPELQPVIGARYDKHVSTIVKSQLKGDELVNYSRDTWTIDDVSYDDYALVSNEWQQMMDYTELAHRHSHCFYGKRFTTANLRQLYTDENRKHIKSMYYRLPHKQNAESLTKDKLWQDTKAEDISDLNVSDIMCSLDGDTGCDCAM